MIQLYSKKIAIQNYPDKASQEIIKIGTDVFYFMAVMHYYNVISRHSNMSTARLKIGIICLENSYNILYRYKRYLICDNSSLLSCQGI